MTPEERINDMQMQINTLKLEIKRINSIVNIDHSKLNQLTTKFNAHRDKKDIHEKGLIQNANKQRT